MQTFIRLTHTGLYKDGRPNTKSVHINDLDVGYENQRRKVPIYVPAGGYIDVAMSSRSMLSFEVGAIRKFVNDGVITAKEFFKPESYSSLTRPPASLYPAGTSVWNTSDNAMNWSDGTNWRDSA